MKEFRNPPNVHPPVGAYTHQVEISGPERWLILSGQVGRKEDGTVPEDPIEQLDLALDNIFRNLQAAKMGTEDLLKLTFYLVGEIDATRRREVIASRLQSHQPCMTLLYVAALASPDLQSRDRCMGKPCAVGMDRRWASLGRTHAKNDLLRGADEVWIIAFRTCFLEAVLIESVRVENDLLRDSRYPLIADIE